MTKKIRYDLGDGRIARFSGKKFKKAVWEYQMEAHKNGEKMTQTRTIEELADEVMVSSSTIKHWLHEHNAPSDFEKVEAIASFLNTTPENLLVIENEEENEMKATNEQVSVMTMEKADYASARDAVKNIYASMVGYIEMFRSIVRQDVEDYAAEPLRAYFIPMYTQLMLSRLDIPADTYKKLCSFAENYLQQMEVFARFVGKEKEAIFWMKDVDTYENRFSPWWDGVYSVMDRECEDAERFSSAIASQFREDWRRIEEESVWYDICEGNVIIDTAYSRLEEILADYMVK